MSGYVNTGALTTTDWLAEHLDDPQVAVIEVDEDTTAYDGAHIPGAVALDWRQELHAHPEREFVSATALADLLGGKGVGTNRAIVLYGGNHNWFAAYAYWLFRLRGIDTVRSLDGGRMKWERDGRALTRRVPDRARTEFRTGRELPQLRVFRDEVITHAGNGGATLVDVRSPEEYSGKVLAPPHLPQEQPYVGGHIPGAANIPRSRAVRGDGSFRPADELRTLYGDAGIAGNGGVITYCRIGERSAHTWFVLTELLGYPDVRNYDGSWTEYGSLVGVPVARGESAGRRRTTV